MKSMNKQMGRIEFKETPEAEETSGAAEEAPKEAVKGAAAKGSARE